MTVYELNRDQLEELKQRYYMDHVNENPSYGELAEIDDLISDEEVYEEYAGTDFVVDDFFSSAGQDEDDTCRVVIEDANRHDIAFDLQYIAEQIDNGYTHGILSDGATWYIE